MNGKCSPLRAAGMRADSAADFVSSFGAFTVSFLPQWWRTHYLGEMLLTVPGSSVLLRRFSGLAPSKSRTPSPQSAVEPLLCVSPLLHTCPRHYSTCCGHTQALSAHLAAPTMPQTLVQVVALLAPWRQWRAVINKTKK